MLKKYKRIGFICLFIGLKLNAAAQENTNNEKITIEDTIISVIEEYPEFQGKNDALLQDTVKYPKEELLEGRVLIGFTVEKDGSLTNFEIVESSGHPALDEEALRVVQLMPKWKPSKRGRYQIPIVFTLD